MNLTSSLSSLSLSTSSSLSLLYNNIRSSSSSWLFDSTYSKLLYRASIVAPIQIIQMIAPIVCIILIYVGIRYRRSITKHIQTIDQQLSRGLVYRDTTSLSTRSNKKTTTSSSTTSSDDDDDDGSPLPPPRKIVKCLELLPEFVENNPDWQLCSMGEYFSTLRFFTQDGLKKPSNNNDKDDRSSAVDQDQGMLSKAVERELKVAMGSAILTSFGPTIGGAMLPLLGIQPVDSVLGMIVSRFISWIMANIFVDYGHEYIDPIEGDIAAMPFNVSELISFVNLNQKFRQPGRNKQKKKELEQQQQQQCQDESESGSSSSLSSLPSPLDWMDRGEVAYDPTYYTPNDSSTDNHDNKEPPKPTSDSSSSSSSSPSKQVVLIPNPFIVEDHFESAIVGLEDRIQQQQQKEAVDVSTTTSSYDPHDKSLPKPTPINEHILPGLHLGWGDAECTHTKREILRNRLFAVLLTKLSRNYHCRLQQQQQKDANSKEDYFVVQMNGRIIKFPDEFVQILVDTGHKIEVCPRSTITTFGLSACVKEDDGSWTNIPLAFFFRSGYERFNQRPVYFATPHGGVDMSIQGPLVGTNPITGSPNQCNIQFYMAIEGMCGWHSNHNANVPWIQSVATTDIYSHDEAISAIRMSAILACVFNGIGTELNLPFGGYGVLGVCNDTAAFVDCAVRGKTNMYPLLSTGRFLMYTSARMMEMKKALSSYDDVKLASEDAHRLAAAACRLESDLHCSPINLIGATRRYLANYPISYFQIMEDSREEMKHISVDYKQFVEGQSLDPDKRISVSKFVDFLMGKEKDEEFE